MNAAVIDGLRIAISEFLRLGIWLIVGLIPFWEERRFKKSIIIILVVFLTAILCFPPFYLRVFRYDNFLLARKFKRIIDLVYYISVIIFFMACFKVFWGKILYVLMFIYITSSLINFISFMSIQLTQGIGAQVGLEATPAIRYITIILNLVTIPFLAKFFRTKFGPMLRKMPNTDSLLMCVIPFMFSITLFLETTTKVRISVDNYLWSVVVMFTNISAILSFFMNMLIIRSNNSRAYAEAQVDSINKILELQQRGYAQLTDNIFQAKAMRHDIRFHLSTLSAFSKEKDYEKLDKYLEEYSHNFEETAITELSNHHTVDVLAKHFVSIMQEHGAKTDVLLEMPLESNISDSDLCTIVGNLFENAAIALKKQGNKGFFYARCVTDKGKLVLTTRNSYKGSKSDIVPGTGLKSVAAIAEKYNGGLKHDVNAGEFTASVLMFI